jgi:hypothetical protein
MNKKFIFQCKCGIKHDVTHKGNFAKMWCSCGREYSSKEVEKKVAVLTNDPFMKRYMKQEEYLALIIKPPVWKIVPKVKKSEDFKKVERIIKKIESQ